jgi:DNA-binding NarL/FixJ family response regulator
MVRQLFDAALPHDDAERARLFTGAARATEQLFGATDMPGDETGRPRQAPGSLYSLLNGLYWLVVNLARAAPVVLLVDDIQWADVPSARFLGFLARRLDSVAVLVVVANRTEADPGDGLIEDILAAQDVTVLTPRNLSGSAVANLVRGALGLDADATFCTACHSITHGNPLFVRELLRVLVANGARPDAATAPFVEAAGPHALRRYVIARLRHQPTDVQAVARAVAVLGDDTDLTLVAHQANLPRPAAVAAVEQLAHQGIFDQHDSLDAQQDTPSFVHAVVRQVVLSLIPRAERSAEHARAAAVLTEGGEPVVRIASHLLRTDPDANPDRVDVLLAAADQARRRGSPGNAAVYLSRARTEPPPRALRSEVNRLLGNCQVHQQAMPEAEAHLREALALAESSPVQRALCAYSLARLLNARGAAGEAVDLLAAAVEELPRARHADLFVDLQAELIGIARTDLGRRSQLLVHLASYQRHPGMVRAVADAQLSLEAVFSGEPADAAAALARRALAGDQLAPDRAAVWAATHTLLVADRLDEAERHLNQALRTTLERGLLFPVVLIRGYLARVAFLRGDLAQAAEHVALGTQDASATNFALPVLHATQVELLLADDRLAEADAVVESGVLAGGGEPSTVLQLWLLGARIRLRAAQGATGAALADALGCGRLYTQWGARRMLDVPWRVFAAQAHDRLGEHDRAAELAAEELRLARAFGVPRHIGLAQRVTASLAENSAVSRQLLAEAVGLLESSPARLELATTLEQQGALLLQDGENRAAGEILGRAAELAAQCHAEKLTQRLHTLLTRSGARVPGRGLSGVDAFTPSERQVAELASIGLTNRQIAERLFVSEKTVEAHLSRAYRKLGVHSRTQLTVRVVEARSSG